MTVWCLGSINADHFYEMPHLVRPGETLAATGFSTGLGGKGANQSVAAAKAGARVVHIGAVGEDGAWAVDCLAGFGVETHCIETVSAPTGHAIIQVDDTGENAIVIYSGANLHVTVPDFSAAEPGDILILQNETNGTVEAAKRAQAKGLFVAYSAAPFDVAATREILPYVNLLLVNQGENDALEAALGAVDVERIVTRGANGAQWIGADSFALPAFSVSEVVDTTGAGDCFAGTLLASLDLGLNRHDAMHRAVVAAALQVTKKGTADAMPSKVDVDAALGA